jgi:hypothetical protein
MATPTVTRLDLVHTAILEALRNALGDTFKHYGLYEPQDEVTEAPHATLITPALILRQGATTFDGLSDPTGRLAARCGWGAQCILSQRTARLQAALPQCAALVAAVVLPSDPAGQPRRGNQWSLGGAVERPENVGMTPGGFIDLHGRDSWTVTWEQVIYLAEDLPQ